MGLSKRERLLIFVAAVIAVVFLTGQFALIPMYTHYTEISEEYDILLMEKIHLDMKIMNEALTTMNYERAVEKFDEINKAYPIDMPNTEIASTLTELCQRSGFSSIFSLAVSPRNVLSEDIYAFSSASVSMSLNGSYGALRTLIDTLEEIDYIRISQISFAGLQPTDGAGGAGSNISVSFNLTILN
jgi:hypothetical protein